MTSPGGVRVGTVLTVAAVVCVWAAQTQAARYLSDGPGAVGPPPPPSPGSLCRTVGAVDGFPVIPQAPGGGAVRDLSPLQDVRRDMGMENLPTGGDGAGVRVGVVEFDWDPDHIELDGRVPPRPPYRRSGGSRDVSHGTASLALIAGRRDSQGITGLVPAAVLRPVSPLRGGDDDDYVPAAAIAQAAVGLRRGDVLLVELQSEWMGPADTGTWGGPVADAIAAATAAGLVVVLPAGNAGRDVAEFGTPRVDAAILVGGGAPGAPDDVLATRSTLSNHGTRIDVQGPAYGVVSATSAPGYYPFLIGGEDTASRSYTHCFNGTSSAAAAVTGAIAAMQGIARAGRGTPFTPDEVRARLAATGLPQPDPDAGRIGPLPRVRAAADLLPPPAATDLSPARNGQVAAGEVTLRWVSPPDDDPQSSGRSDDVLLVDGREVARVPAGTGQARVTLDAGSHVWSVRALDRVGNASQVDASITVAPRAAGAGTGTPPSVADVRRAAGVVRSVAWASRRRVLVVRVALAAGARVTVAGRRGVVRRGLVRVALRPPRRGVRAVSVVLTGNRLARVAYRVTLPSSGRPRLRRLGG